MDYKQYYNVSPCIFPAAEINLFPDGKQDKRAERIFRIIQQEVGGAAGVEISCVVLAASVFARRFELTRAS